MLHCVYCAPLPEVVCQPDYLATAGSGAAFILCKRYITAAAGENSIVLAEVTDELEVLLEA